MSLYSIESNSTFCKHFENAESLFPKLLGSAAAATPYVLGHLYSNAITNACSFASEKVNQFFHYFIPFVSQETKDRIAYFLPVENLFLSGFILGQQVREFFQDTEAEIYQEFYRPGSQSTPPDNPTALNYQAATRRVCRIIAETFPRLPEDVSTACDREEPVTNEIVRIKTALIIKTVKKVRKHLQLLTVSLAVKVIAQSIFDTSFRKTKLLASYAQYLLKDRIRGTYKKASKGLIYTSAALAVASFVQPLLSASYQGVCRAKDSAGLSVNSVFRRLTAKMEEAYLATSNYLYGNSSD